MPTPKSQHPLNSTLSNLSPPTPHPPSHNPPVLQGDYSTNSSGAHRFKISLAAFLVSTSTPISPFPKEHSRFRYNSTHNPTHPFLAGGRNINKYRTPINPNFCLSGSKHNVPNLWIMGSVMWGRSPRKRMKMRWSFDSMKGIMLSKIRVAQRT